MKKLTILIFMFFPIFTVNAEEWKEVEKVPVINGSTLEIKEEKEYRWYKIKKEGGYFKEAPSKEFTKTDFWTLSPWSAWQEEYPNGKDIVESKTVYHYQLMKKIKYIRLSQKNNPNFIFASIQIYKGRNLIPYQLEEKSDCIIIELEEPCYFDQLEVEITLVNGTHEENAFLIEWLYDLDLPSCVQIYTRHWFSVSMQTSFIERKMIPNQFLYEKENISLEKIEPNSHTKVSKTEQYRYQERLSYYEKETKEYSKEFSSNMIEGYPYPDLKTERKRLFCRWNQKDAEVKEVIVTKEIPVEKMIVRENPGDNLLQQENIFLKQEIDNLKFRIATSQNEKSENLEKNKKFQKIEIKKQSLEAPFYIVIFFFGYLLGRIVAMKKKF